MARKERTVKKSAELEGIALHSGESVAVRLEPAPAGTGIVFTRGDIEDSADIPALAGNLAQTRRRTVLKEGSSEVGMVEHLLSACNGLGVDNLHVRVQGEELPGLDGSAKRYVEALRKSGIVDQKRDRKILEVQEPIVLREGEAEIVVLPPSGEGLRIRYFPVFPDGVDDTPVDVRLTPEVFEKEIAPARTFVLAEEVDEVLASGLGKGATAENTLVLGGDSNPEFRVDHEPVRHKILDLVGDLALIGADLNADIIATRSGHALNQDLARHLRGDLEARETGTPAPDVEYDISSVMRLLPHRYPFLLVDRVIEVDGFRRAVGIKNVTINEPFFQGHFPDKPLMPGVLQLEALAQLSGFLLQRKLEHTGKLVVLASIDKVRFRGSVVPGDQLRLEVETLRLGRNRGQVKAQGKVGRRVVSEAVLSFAMISAT
jgi:UDP-3-O-[3-hydroxymyristoyl] N-acetylglucosamine deacetylase/3-hydroxyacyl-[acyl-carrier-protein] dehydratase